MFEQEIRRLDALSELELLLQDVRQWGEQPTGWRPVRRCQALLRRVLDQAERWTEWLDAPIVVATFGGTGTGKSALVNALVGEECTPTGRERPTTQRPVLVVHTKTDVGALGLPLEEVEVRRSDAPLLQHVALLDCPDPDTSWSPEEGERSTATGNEGRSVESPAGPNGTGGSSTASGGTASGPRESRRDGLQTDRATNLQRLRRLLPYCDVLIYTSTQQKYRSARVGDELRQAATGRRLLFVQTHASQDVDVREDWRRQLQEEFDVPEIFFVDSVKALQRRRRGEPPDGDLARLLKVLEERLAEASRARLRQANLLDLLCEGLEQCRRQLAEAWSAVEALRRQLREQSRRAAQRFVDWLRADSLETERQFEARVLGEVAQQWGGGFFTTSLRAYNAAGTLLTTFLLLRARTATQAVVAGLVRGGAWLVGKRESQGESRRRPAAVLDDAFLRECRLVAEGFVRDAQLDRPLEKNELARLRKRAARLEEEFATEAEQQVHRLTCQAAAGVSRRWCKWLYEALLGGYVGLVLVRVGENFFYGALIKPWLGQAAEPLLSLNFYVPALLFFLLWSWFLIWTLRRAVRARVRRDFKRLLSELAETKLSGTLFPELEQACSEADQQREQLEQLHQRARRLSEQLGQTAGLGARRTADAT